MTSGAREVDRSEAGAATAEMVIATPILLFMLMLVVHVGLWFHATHVASAAAQEGAQAARRSGASAQGEAVAHAFLDSLGSTIVAERQVRVTVDTETARVEVTGTGPSVVPGLRSPIRAVSEGPVERFRPDVP